MLIVLIYKVLVKGIHVCGSHGCQPSKLMIRKEKKGGWGGRGASGKESRRTNIEGFNGEDYQRATREKDTNVHDQSAAGTIRMTWSVERLSKILLCEICDVQYFIYSKSNCFYSERGRPQQYEYSLYVKLSIAIQSLNRGGKKYWFRCLSCKVARWYSISSKQYRYILISIVVVSVGG